MVIMTYHVYHYYIKCIRVVKGSSCILNVDTNIFMIKVVTRRIYTVDMTMESQCSSQSADVPSQLQNRPLSEHFNVLVKE